MFFVGSGVAVVTGGSGGIGAATVQRLAALVRDVRLSFRERIGVGGRSSVHALEPVGAFDPVRVRPYRPRKGTACGAILGTIVGPGCAAALCPGNRSAAGRGATTGLKGYSRNSV